jgi:hypothetical protein
MPTAAQRSGTVTAEIPRPEHPRPQLEREQWLSLNGPWTIRRNRRVLGHLGEPTLLRGRRLEPADVGPFDQSIIVPFAPESSLSGLGFTEFIESLDYHREINIPPEWGGRDVLLHFGGVDFHADVFIDGVWVASHSGGSAPFSVDLTRHVSAGSGHDLTVQVQDYIHAGDQGGGKQSHHGGSYGCFYTRTTGIWQTVWLEALHPAGLADVFIVSDIHAGAFHLSPEFRADSAGRTWRVHLALGGHAAGTAEGPARSGLPLTLPVSEPRLWSPEDPVLYELEIEVISNGEVVDRVSSYAGLREVAVQEGKVYLNGRATYLRFVLDQGYYPDGIWTAPSDDALRRDIELSIAAGFNGARLHQKVFEDRYHYWADRLGYLTWSEWASWGFDFNNAHMARHFLSEVRRVTRYLRNHPSIIAWTPYNETGNFTNPRSHHLNHIDAYEICKSIDPTRPVNDASGYIHHRTDLWTVHSYKATGQELHAELVPDAKTTEDIGSGSGDRGTAEARTVFRNHPDREAEYDGRPYLVDEFGGIAWTGADPASHERSDAWGYGDTPRTEEEFFTRLEGLVDTLLSIDHVAGWCYTQLTDVEQEQNGVYYYDRSPKFDPDKLQAVFGRKPDGFEL